MPSAPNPCRFFASGNCKFGTDCRFLHVDDGSNHAANSSTSPTAQQAGNGNIPQTFSYQPQAMHHLQAMQSQQQPPQQQFQYSPMHMQFPGTGMAPMMPMYAPPGGGMPYMVQPQHLGGASYYPDPRMYGSVSPTGAPTTSDAMASPTSPKSPSGAAPCTYYMQGRCSKGANCRFRHSVEDSPGGPPSVGGRGVPAAVEAITDIGCVYSIDVECVATGVQHHDRATAQIALVDSNATVIVNIFVKPTMPVVSYLTPLTGIDAATLDDKGVRLDEAMTTLRQALPSNAVLVGQNILKDVEWLGLRQGVDFASMIDLQAILKVWNPKFNQFSYFSLEHYSKAWGISGQVDGEPHDAATDATVSIKLFMLFRDIASDPAALEDMRERTLAVPTKPSFAKENPTFEGVCQGNKKTCTCGAPFYS